MTKVKLRAKKIYWTNGKNKPISQTFKVFCYGSNMSSKRLLKRTPSAKALFTTFIPEYKLKLHKRSADKSGKGNAFYTGDKNDKLYGVVFEIDTREKPALDEAEGKGNGYNEEVIALTNDKGEKVSAFILKSR